ncbi:MAG: hypothetical protein ACJA00_005735 [Myxococcota bacterium]
MRDWDSTAEALNAAGGHLVILSADTPEVVAAAIAEEELTSPITSVSPLLWEQWGVANTRRPDLPIPATYIVAEDGTVVWVKQTAIVGGRTRAQRVVSVIENLRDGEPTVVTAPRAKTREPDWDTAATVRGVQTEDGTAVVMTIADGFHVYGRRECNARPLQVWVDGQQVRAKVPPGRAVDTVGTRTHGSKELFGWRGNRPTKPV